jgi:N-acetylmuramoyl-L-alanine amidase
VDSLNKKIPYSTKAQTAKILHQLENLYINAVVSDDKAGVKSSLKSIITCKHLLGLSAKNYEKELSVFTGKKTHKSNSIKNFSKQKQLTITSIKQHKSTLIIKFNNPITKSNMIFFELNKPKLYKDIYDIKAKIGSKVPKLSINYIDNINIAQNRSDKVRLVLKDSNKIYSTAYIRDGSLFIQVHKNPDKYITKNIKYKPKMIQHKTKKIQHKTKTVIKRSINKKSKIIVVDPGHGGKDSGAVGYKKYREKHTVLKVSKLIAKLLRKSGYTVYMTRDSDRFIDLHKRTEFANKKGADLFISIHANASPSSQKLTLRGLETFFLSPAKSKKAKNIASKENSFAVRKMNDMSKNTLLSFLNKNKIVQSHKLAIDIQKGMISQIRKKYKNTKDGGVREAPFWVLVGAQMPAVLVETGYITNPTEADRLFNPFYQKALSIGIVDGINNYFVNN